MFSRCEGDPYAAVKILEFKMLMCLIQEIQRRLKMSCTTSFSLFLVRAIQHIVADVLVSVSSNPPERRQFSFFKGTEWQKG